MFLKNYRTKKLSNLKRQQTFTSCSKVSTNPKDSDGRLHINLTLLTQGFREFETHTAVIKCVRSVRYVFFFFRIHP